MEQDAKLDLSKSTDIETCWKVKLPLNQIKGVEGYEQCNFTSHHPMTVLTVGYYETAFRLGYAAYLTPITVFKVGENLYEVEDGWHRVTAAVNTNQEFINAVVLD